MALYENGGITKMAQNNATNAEKAKAYDDLQRQRRDDDIYSVGRNDGGAEVQSAVAQRLAEISAAANKYGLSDQWQTVTNSMTNKPDSYPLTAEDVSIIAGDRNPDILTKELDALRAKSDGQRLNYDDLGFLSRSSEPVSAFSGQDGSPSWVKDKRSEIRSTPEFKKALQELEAQGWLPDPRDPNSDIDAVDKYLYQKNLESNN